MAFPIQKHASEWQALLAQKDAEPLALAVTRQAATERPFSGRYNDHWVSGAYHCISCGQPLFASDAKFDAGCGWPSFFRMLSPGSMVERADHGHGMPQAFTPGKSMFGFGAGTYRGQSAFAMGVSTMTDNGKWVIKGSLSGDSRGNVGGSVGAGFQW